MLIKKIRLFLILIIMLTAAPAIAGTYSGGSGTSEDPYQIATLDDLQELQDTSGDWIKSFIQTADIDATATSGWDGGAGFSPIGNNTTKFTGSYNGDSYTITSLYIDRSSTDNIGMFGYVDTAGEVNNAGLVTNNVTGQVSVGGLVGYNNNTVSDSYTTGNVIGGDRHVGGLIGINYGSVSNSYAIGTVTGTSNDGAEVGGLIGYSYTSTSIINCYSTGNVIGIQEVGGLVGDNKETLSSCYATGTVTSNTDECGGLVGVNYGTVSDSYATGNVVGSNDEIGGFVGDNQGVVSDSYATGTVSGSLQVGGFAGIDDGTVSGCYSTGNASGDNGQVGGFVGNNDAGNTTSNSYSTGNATRSSGTDTSYGAFCGYNEDTITYSYSIGSVYYTGGSDPSDKGFVGADDGSTTYTSNFFDSEASNQTTSGFSSATGKTTSQMKTQSTFTGASWNFSTIWAINLPYNSGYPYLQWRFPAIGNAAFFGCNF